MKVVSAKLLLSCLNDYSMDYDGFTENNPAYIYEDHLSYINSCFGKINYEYILGALNISYVKYLNAILNTEHFYLSLVYKLINIGAAGLWEAMPQSCAQAFIFYDFCGGLNKSTRVRGVSVGTSS